MVETVVMISQRCSEIHKRAFLILTMSYISESGIIEARRDRGPPWVGLIRGGFTRLMGRPPDKGQRGWEGLPGNHRIYHGLPEIPTGADPDPAGRLSRQRGLGFGGRIAGKP